jgi:hypothetical protein
MKAAAVKENEYALVKARLTRRDSGSAQGRQATRTVAHSSAISCTLGIHHTTKLLYS